MEASENSVNVLITEKAVAFIKSKRLINPVILVNVTFRPASGGEGCGGGCSGGGCGDEGNSGKVEAYVNILLVDGGKPGADFVKIDTAAGIPVYLAKQAYEAARKSNTTVIIGVRGLVMKKLGIEGLNNVLQGGQSQPRSHQGC